jgi:DNA-binding winged helix-turn-helix (wHTH) protein
MTPPRSPALYRFGLFEADTATAELRRQGVRIKLNAQPFQVLALLLDRPNELLTREDIARELWPNETFVDFEHGVNSAINRIREALGDTAANPRFVETLARRGYRFVAPVVRLAPAGAVTPAEASTPTTNNQEPSTPEPHTRTYLASTAELPKTSRSVVQTLFVLLQCMYVAFYVGALANLPEIADLLSPLPSASKVFVAIIATAAILIPVRAFVISAALFHAPGFREKLLKIWPFLLVADILWSLSPFLLLHHINFGLALACTPLLVYSPFAQRALILMGAGIPIPVAPEGSTE